MALNFPDSPTLNEVYTDSTSGFSYQWNGSVWTSFESSTASNIQELDDISSSFNGVTTTFALTVGGQSITPVTTNQLVISVGGVIQNPTNDFYISGSNIVFTTPPAGGLTFFGTLLGTALSLNTIADGSVTPLKLSTGGPSWNTSGDVYIAGVTTVTNASGTVTIGIGTTALLVEGNARVTGILTVGTGSLTIDGTNNKISSTTNEVKIGAGLTVNNSGVVAGVVTATTFNGNVTIGAGSTSAPSLSPSGDSNTGIFFPSADTIAFAEGGAEAARFDSSGRFLVGTTSTYTDVVGGAGGYTGPLWLATNDSVGTGPFISTWTSSADLDQMGTSIVLSRSKGNAIGTHGALSSGNAIGTISFNGSDGSKFVAGAVIRAEIDGGVSTSDLPTRLIFATTADGSSSPTERMRVTNSGVIRIAQSTVDDPGNLNTTNGAAFLNDGALLVSRANPVLYINRNTTDGTLVSLRQDGTEEGNISVSGSTVSYNGAHLSRWSQITGIDPHDKDQRPEILRGTVMSNLDEMCTWIDPETGEPQANEQLNKTKISDVEGDKDVAGIFQGWDDDDDIWVNDFYLAMTGDFIIRIAAGVTVERGDLLLSAGDGTAKPQADDLVRSCTVAKVTSTNVICTYDDGSYCVPCVLMAC